MEILNYLQKLNDFDAESGLRNQVRPHCTLFPLFFKIKKKFFFFGKMLQLRHVQYKRKAIMLKN